MVEEKGNRSTLDIVVPLFNEGDGCARFHSELLKALAGLRFAVRVIYVNDGSTDGTQGILDEIRSSDRSVAVIELSRNFGHQAALTAGLDAADADVVVMMDGDGQHPPSLIPEMLRLYEAGFDVVQGRRTDALASASVLKRSTSELFYAMLNRLADIEIGSGVADFRLVSREVLEALRALREYHRFVRGMIPWLGFKTALLPYIPPKRLAGTTKYSFRKMIILARDGLFSFSLFPLRLSLFVGSLFMLLALAEIAYVASFFFREMQDRLVPGWSSLVILLTLSSGTTMILLGFIGIYVGMIFQEVKGRPIYVVRRRLSPDRVPAE